MELGVGQLELSRSPESILVQKVWKGPDHTEFLEWKLPSKCSYHMTKMFVGLHGRFLQFCTHVPEQVFNQDLEQ